MVNASVEREQEKSYSSERKEARKNVEDGVDEDWGVKQISVDENRCRGWSLRHNDQNLTDSKLGSSICELSVSIGETKEIDAQNASFVTDASSNMDAALESATASRGYFKDKERGRLKPHFERTRFGKESAEEGEGNNEERETRDRRKSVKKESEKIDSVWNDSIYLEIQYGMEIAELLELYSIQRSLLKRKSSKSC